MVIISKISKHYTCQKKNLSKELTRAFRRKLIKNYFIITETLRRTKNNDLAQMPQEITNAAIFFHRQILFERYSKP